MNSDIKALYIHIPFCLSKCSYCAFYSKSSVEEDGDSIDDELFNNFIRAKSQKDDFKLLICLLKMFCAGIICSYVSVVIFSLLGQKFFNILPLTWVGVIKYTAIFVPYFLILQRRLPLHHRLMLHFLPLYICWHI